jgi:cell division septal protein FtsQ
MPVLKGKKKILFFLISFLLLTTYDFNKEISLPLFKIQKINFINNINLEENIKDDIIVSLKNKSLLDINNKKISTIIAKSQWVKNFKIKKNYPNQISLQFEEFTPVALLKKNNKLYLINSNFEITDKIVSEDNDFNLLKISGMYEKEKFKNKLSEIKKFNISSNIRLIEILNLNRIDFYFKNDIYVKLGDYNISSQMKILKKVLEKYKNLEFIDLRNKGRVIIK